MAEQKREPDRIESEPAPAPVIEDEQEQRRRPSVATPDLSPTGRTTINLQRLGRTIT